MGEVTVPAMFLLVWAAVIILIGVLGELLSRRTGVPEAVWLIGAGAVLALTTGEGGWARFSPYVQFIAVPAVVLVFFESGTRVKFAEMGGNASRAVLLAAVGCVFSLLAVAAAVQLAAGSGFLPANWGWVNSLTLGAGLAAPGYPLLATAMGKAAADRRVGIFLGVESALADVMCLLAVILFGRLALGDGAGMTLKACGLGLAMGAAVGAIWILFLKAMRSSPHAYPMALAVAILLYAAAERFGGSGPFAVLGAAVVLGNASGIGTALKLGGGFDLPEDAKGYRSQTAALVRIFLLTFSGFVLAGGGALSGSAPASPHAILLGAGLAVILLAVRWGAVETASRGSGLDEVQRRLLKVAFPRGLAPVALVLLPVMDGVAGADAAVPVAYSAVFVSMLIFAAWFPAMRRGLGLPGSLYAAGDMRRLAPVSSVAAYRPAMTASIGGYANAGDAQCIAQTPLAPTNSYSSQPSALPMASEPVALFDPLPPLDDPAPHHRNTVRPDDPDEIKPGSGFHW